MGGEAGDGVDLIEDDFPIRGEEQIHPGEYPAVQGTVSRPIYTCEVNNDFLQTLLDALRHRVGRMV